MTQTATAEVAAKDRLSVTQAPRSLLVIEDDLSMIHFIDAILDDSKPGLKREYCTTGEQAIDLIRTRGIARGEDPFSLVITDIFLDGEMTGFDVWLDCQQLFPRMPFVITSCLTFDRYFSILRGVSNCPVYLPKPLTVSRCQSVIEEYF